MPAKSRGGKRRPGSIVGDEPDVAKKAPLTTPEPDGPAPGEGTVAKDPKVEEASEGKEEE